MEDDLEDDLPDNAESLHSISKGKYEDVEDLLEDVAWYNTHIVKIGSNLILKEYEHFDVILTVIDYLKNIGWKTNGTIQCTEDYFYIFMEK